MALHGRALWHGGTNGAIIGRCEFSAAFFVRLNRVFEIASRMSFRFPSFADSKCVSLTACGRLVTDDKPLLKWISTQETLQARYRAKNRTGFVFVSMGGEAKDAVHIDVSMPEYFRKGLPKATNKISEVRAAVERLYGIRIDAHIAGRYLVGLKNLPPMIASLIADTTVGEVSLRTIGGTIAVTGAPIDVIHWRIWESRNCAALDLNAWATLEINEDYLNTCLGHLDPAFNELLLNV